MAKKHRITNKELSDAIFRPDQDIKLDGPMTVDFEQEDRETIVFTLFGKHDELNNTYPILLDDEDKKAIDSKFAFAKIVKVNGKSLYFIKRGVKGDLLNPIDFDEGHFNKWIRHAGRKMYEFDRVGIKTFNLYIHFLKTKNKAYLKRAEREIL